MDVARPPQPSVVKRALRASLPLRLSALAESGAGVWFETSGSLIHVDDHGSINTFPCSHIDPIFYPQSLAEVLHATNVRHPVFAAVLADHVDRIEAVMRAVGLQVSRTVNCSRWELRKRRRAAKVPSVPEGYRVDELRVEDADTVNAEW